jgi:hypothetical protein
MALTLALAPFAGTGEARWTDGAVDSSRGRSSSRGKI